MMAFGRSSLGRLSRADKIDALKQSLTELYALGADISREVLARRAARRLQMEWQTVFCLLERLTEEEELRVGLPEMHRREDDIAWYTPSGKPNRRMLELA